MSLGRISPQGRRIKTVLTALLVTGWRLSLTLQIQGTASTSWWQGGHGTLKGQVRRLVLQTQEKMHQNTC